MNKYTNDQIKNHPILSQLELTNEEIKKYYCEIQLVLDEYNECINTSQLCKSPYHFRLIRNKYHKLEIISIECEKYLKDLNYLRQKYLVYTNDIIDIDYSLKPDKIDLDSNVDSRRIKKLINHLIEIRKNPINQANIYVFGPSNSKSYLFKCLLNDLVYKNYKCAYLNMKILAKDLNVNMTKTIQKLDYLKDVDILFIDDLGNEEMSFLSTYLNNLFLLFDYRYQKKILTIINSNYKISDLTKIYSLKNNIYFQQDEMKNQIDKFTNLLTKMITKDNYFHLDKKR